MKTLSQLGVFLLATLLPSTIQAQQGLRWSSNGPICAQPTSFVGAPELTNVAYLAIDGRVFRSQDDRRTWQETGSVNPVPFISVAFDPRRPDTVLAVSGEDFFGRGIYRSQDGGGSWQLIEGEVEELFFDKIHIALSEPPAAFAVGRNAGLFRSIGDSTWIDITPGSAQRFFMGVVSNPVDPRQVWLLTDDEIWRSEDQGDTWSLVSGGLMPNGRLFTLRIHPSVPQTVYVLDSQHLFVTTDGGGEWRDLGPLPLNLGPVREAFAIATDGSLFAGQASSGIPAAVLRSSDGGVTWEEAGLHGETVHGLQWLNGGVLVALTASGLFASEDRGDTWQRIDAGINASQVGAVAYVSTDHTTLLAGLGECEDSRVARSEDGGRTWETGELLFQLNSIDALGVAPSDPQRILAGGDGPGIYRSLDGGLSWTYRRLTTSSSLGLLDFAFHPQDPDIVFAVTSSPEGLMRSLDGGITWTTVQPIGGSQEATVAFAPYDPQILLYAWLGLHRSVDGGETWQHLDSVPGSTTHILFDPDRPGFVLAGGDVGESKLLLSTDGGVTWSVLEDSPILGTLLGLARDSTGVMWLSHSPDAFTTRARLLASFDGGLNWEPALAGLPRDFVDHVVAGTSEFAVSPTGGLAVAGSPYGVFVLERCRPGPETACLLSGRFQVQGTMRTFDDPPAEIPTRAMEFPSARAESDQAVFFESFTAGNFEAGVKLVDACGLPQDDPLRAFWAFFGGLTNAEAEIEIEDTVTGQIYRWQNPRGDFPLTLADTRAFPCVDGVPVAACVRDEEVACLIDGRFRVSGRMQSFDDPPEEVPTRVMSFPADRAESDQAIFFESFSPGNFEIAVKMVDACGLPADHPLRGFWVFYGGLTNAAAEVRVTRMDTGRTDVWRTSPGVLPRSEGRTSVFPCEE